MIQIRVLEEDSCKGRKSVRILIELLVWKYFTNQTAKAFKNAIIETETWESPWTNNSLCNLILPMLN